MTNNKAARQYTLIFKRFDVNRNLSEVRILGNSNSKTYSKVFTSEDDMINENARYWASFELRVTTNKKI